MIYPCWQILKYVISCKDLDIIIIYVSVLDLNTEGLLNFSHCWQIVKYVMSCISYFTSIMKMTHVRNDTSYVLVVNNKNMCNVIDIIFHIYEMTYGSYFGQNEIGDVFIIKIQFS